MSFPFKIDSAYQGVLRNKFIFETTKTRTETSFGTFRNKTFVLVFFSRFYTRTETFDVSIEPKQTEDQPKQFDREHILVFFRKFRVVSVCFETVLFVSVVSIQVRNTETNRNFLFLVSRNKPKHNRNRSCFVVFRFEPKFFYICFEDTLVPTSSRSCLKFSIQPKMASSVKLQQMKEMRVFKPSVTIPQASSEGLSKYL